MNAELPAPHWTLGQRAGRHRPAGVCFPAGTPSRPQLLPERTDMLAISNHCKRDASNAWQITH